MKRILKAITGLYNRLVGGGSNTIDNKVERIQESVRAYNITIDSVIHNNAKLLGGE